MNYLIIYFVLIIFYTQYSFSNINFDPYKVLGLSRGADEREIKNAYRKLAKHWLVFIIF